MTPSGVGTIPDAWIYAGIVPDWTPLVLSVLPLPQNFCKCEMLVVGGDGVGEDRVVFLVLHTEISNELVRIRK